MSIASCRRKKGAAKQRKALKARFCEWRGVNSNNDARGKSRKKCHKCAKLVKNEITKQNMTRIEIKELR